LTTMQKEELPVCRLRQKPKLHVVVAEVVETQPVVQLVPRSVVYQVVQAAGQVVPEARDSHK